MADDDFGLDAKDLMDIFGGEDEKPSEDLSKSIEDLFFSGDGEEKGGEKLSLEGIAEAPELPPAAEEAPLVEPDRKGMTEEMLDTVLREGAGKQWDPGITNAFVSLIERHGLDPSLTLPQRTTRAA